MKKLVFPVILVGALWTAPLWADEAATVQPSSPQISAPSEEISTLDQEVAALRQQLRQNTAAIRSAGAASDVLLAEQVTILESLLLKERRLKQLKFAEREAQPGGEAQTRRELQEALAQAESPEARAALLARHRAYQRALASEKALLSRNTESSAASTP